MFRRYESRQTPTSGGTLSPKGIQHTTLPVVLVNIWQASSCRKFMQHLETCLLIAEADRILCHLLMFLTVFSSGCTKWNTATFKILLLFMAGLFTGLLVEKCAARQSHWKSDFGWHRAHLTWCVRGLKSLKRFWPYLIAFRSCISAGKPEKLFCFYVCCCLLFFSGFMKSREVYIRLRTFVRFETTDLT